jgi:hypothetical protein
LCPKMIAYIYTIYRYILLLPVQWYTTISLLK